MTKPESFDILVQDKNTREGVVRVDTWFVNNPDTGFKSIWQTLKNETHVCSKPIGGHTAYVGLILLWKTREEMLWHFLLKSF